MKLLGGILVALVVVFAAYLSYDKWGAPWMAEHNTMKAKCEAQTTLLEDAQAKIQKLTEAGAEDSDKLLVKHQQLVARTKTSSVPTGRLWPISDRPPPRWRIDRELSKRLRPSSEPRE